MNTTVTNETGIVQSLGNTAGAILLDNPVYDSRGAVHTVARVHVNDVEVPVKPGDHVAFELHIDNTGDRNARHVKPV